jgi:hypothetical protein
MVVVDEDLILIVVSEQGENAGSAHFLMDVPVFSFLL